MESKALIEAGRALDLSEQQLVDCVSGASGCSGGWPHVALQYVQEKGQASEAAYAYTGTAGQCAQQGGATKIQQSPGFIRLPANSREALLDAVAAQPTVVCLVVDEGGALAGRSAGAVVVAGGHRLCHTTEADPAAPPQTSRTSRAGSTGLPAAAKRPSTTAWWSPGTTPAALLACLTGSSG